MALELKKKHKLSVLRTFFFSLLTDIHLIFGTLALQYQDTDKFEFEFGFDPLIFHEVMALGLRKKITNY
jgi:hypothetical protein